ncbi:MAG: hypothetical protein WCZ89_06915, partial [Phycisphaerae bacterium]
ICSQEQLEAAQKLISSSLEASKLYESLKKGLSPLDSWEVESCPDELFEKTLNRLKQAGEQSHLKLKALIADEQTRSGMSKRTFWANAGRRLAMAAMFMIVGSIFLSSMNYARHKYWETQCRAQLVGIWNGVNRYSNDNSENIPAVAMSAGTPWWMIGYQGKENYSNTRGVWLLPKGEYVNAQDFVCPGAKTKHFEQINADQINKLRDFPDRQYITYSFQLIGDKPVKISTLRTKVMMSDLNPLFEHLPGDFSKPLHIPLTEELANFNSANHQRKGQNVLFSDGSARFIRGRRVGVSDDDIFTLQGKKFYEGIEFPACDTDIFLAP